MMRILWRSSIYLLALVGVFLAASTRAAEPVPQQVGWSTLKMLTSSSAESSPVRQLNGKRVSIPGFMVPLEDDAQEVTEFLLVPYAGACIHVPPPPPNQMVYVQLTHGGKAKMSFTEPIVVTGVLKITNVKSPYGDVSYNLDGDAVKPYVEQ
ncbi:DUF3299 domain-containing protein [Alloacidobacterium dinghuense]|uniref:DUF3299 domain-containing protein n=1 Tax=Alloacidobacterium dinghuense TaxID=2763107 RepID=A0A7G8BDG7_9BACT|nr:DUF3299 domain-containing protein [Alloacidobacterium dinghuense]QNI30587.1 DUF3299 domain-containing protein [Alloacidobacterium dinghuense]